jgi:hypothetical protein
VDLAVDIICQYARDVEAVLQSESALVDSDVESWLSFLQIVIDEPFRLSMSGAACTIAMMQGLLRIDRETDFDLDSGRMQLLLDGVDATLSYEYFFRSGDQLVEDQVNLVRNVSSLVQSYCEVITDVVHTA